MDDLLMGEQAAQYLGVSYKRLHQLTKEGIGRRLSGHWVFTRTELDQYRASEKNKGGRPKSDLIQTQINRGPEFVTA
jgi:hypothetical protein